MKKIHGTYSIQPLSITDSVVAEDAQIDESKLRLSFNTADIQNNLDNFSFAFTTHANTSADPHGETLQQTILQTEDIRSGAGDIQRTINVSNPGEGDVLLNVEGDIAAVNASFSGDTNIAGVTTIGGQTHITGNVVIDGNLSVSGETTTVESNTIDYDSLLVTPSTALNRTGIIVAPDGTGFDGNSEPETVTTTVQVHDDFVSVSEGYALEIQQLSDDTLVLGLETRLVRVSADMKEILGSYSADGTSFGSMTVGTGGNLFVVTADMENSTTYISRFDNNLNFISRSSDVNNPITGEPAGSWDIYSFKYLNGKFYASLGTSIAIFDEYLYDKYTGEQSFNTFAGVSSSVELDNLLNTSGMSPYAVMPFTDSTSGNDYLCVEYNDNRVALVSSSLSLIRDNIFSSDSETFPYLYDEFQFWFLMDTRTNRLNASAGSCILYSIDVEPFIDPEFIPTSQNTNVTTTALSDDFADPSGDVYPMGIASDSDLIYYNEADMQFIRLDSSKFFVLDNYDPETGEISSDVDTHVVVGTRATAESYSSVVPLENTDILKNEGAGFFKEYQGTLYFIGDINTAHVNGSPEYIQRLDAETGLLGDAVKAERHSSNEVLYYIDPTSQNLPSVTGIDIDSEQNALVVYEKDPTYFIGFNLEDGTRFPLNQDSVDLYKARVKPVGSVTVNNSKQVVCFVYNYTDSANPVWEIRLYPATGGQATKTILINDIVADYELEMSRGAISPDGRWLYCLGYHYNPSNYTVDDIKLYCFNLEGSVNPTANSADCMVYSLTINLTLVRAVMIQGLCVTSDGRAVAAVILNRDAAPNTFYMLTDLVEVDLSNGNVLSDKVSYDSMVLGVAAAGTTVFTSIKYVSNYKNDILILDIGNNGHIATATPRSVLEVNGVTEDSGSGTEEHQDPFEIDSTADPLSSYGLDNFGAMEMTTDADGNFYFVGSAQLADCITKVDAETLASTSIRIGNTVTGDDYLFGDSGVFGVGISSDKSNIYISCSSMRDEVGPTALYRYDLNTRTCNPLKRVADYMQGSYNYGNIWPFRNIWFNSMAMDYTNNHIVMIGGTTDQPNDLGGILILDPEDYSTIKYIHVSSVHSYVSNDRGCVMLCVSPDGNYAYVVEHYTEDGGYDSPRKTALNKIPLNADTSYDPATSPNCRRTVLYGTEDADTYGYPVAIGITPEGRLFVATINGHIFELDSDTLDVVEETDLLSASEKEERYRILSMAVNSNTMLVGYENDDSNWDLENYGLRAYDISNDTLLSEATVTESVPYDGPTPSAPDMSEEPYAPDEPEEPGDVNAADIIRTITQEIEVETSIGDTFLGNLLELQTRTRGLNEAAVIVDKSGNLRLLTGGLEVGGIKGAVNNNTLTFDKGLGAASMITSNAGFIYKPSSDAQPGSKVLDIQDASGISNAFITKNGDAAVNSLTIGSSNAITEAGGGLVVPNDMAITASELKMDDSVLTFSAENKDDWRVLNRNSSISAYFDTDVVPQVELSDGLLDASNCELTKTDNLEVMGSALFRGSVSMAANTTVDGIKVGSHDHTGGEMGTVLPQTAVAGLKTFIDNINTTIKNCVNEMTTDNTESGIDAAYNSNTGKLDLSVNDFTITLSGNASGSATIQHASNTTLSVTVLDSAKLGGLSLSSSTANTDANRVLRTDANGKTSVKALFMSSPTAAGTGTLGKIYASAGNETEVKAYTPANFATQLLALGGTAKNSHTHTIVNGLTPIRGSSTFNGVSGRVIMLSSSRANTNYSVAVTPSAAPNGHLGEIWVIKGTDRFTVYNSGSATSAFDYMLLG